MNCKWVLPTSKYTTHMPFFTKGYCYVLCCHFKGFDFPGNYSFILQELHRRVILCCINSWCSNEGCDHMSPFSMSLSCCRSCSSHGLQERVLMIFCKLYCRDMKGMGRLLPLLRLWFFGLALPSSLETCISTALFTVWAEPSSSTLSSDVAEGLDLFL